ncbi:Beta-lactamase [Paenibacillus alkaliterrae]
MNIAVFAPNAALYEVLIREVTAERVKAHFDGLIIGEVTRYLVPKLLAMNFVCKGALSGGGSATLRMDNLGKCYAASFIRMEIETGDNVNLSQS